MYAIRYNSKYNTYPPDTDPGAQSKGALSSRMQIPGNTWQLVWDAAKPVPARRQKRLFDDTMEAEKILHYFEAQTIGQIVRLTLVALVHTSIVQMREPSAAVAAVRVPNFGELHDRLVAACCKLSREAWSDGPVGMRCECGPPVCVCEGVRRTI